MINHIKSTLTKKEGITITELLVASVMIAIVMIGVASFALAINQFQFATNKSVTIALKTKTAMALMTQDAVKSVGDKSNRGVYYQTNGTNMSSICFRHDLLSTPEDYSDDQWICYAHILDFELHRCINPTTDISFFSGCTGLGGGPGCCTGATLDEVILTLADDNNEIGEVIENGNGDLLFIDLTLTTRFIFNQIEHPVDNPEYTLSTQISPLAHSR